MSDLADKIRERRLLNEFFYLLSDQELIIEAPSKEWRVRWDELCNELHDWKTNVSSREVVLGLVAATVVEIRLEEAKHWSSFYPHQHGTSAIDCANCSACTRTKTLENEAAAERQMKRGSGT